MVVEGGIKGVFILAKMADHIAKMVAKMADHIDEMVAEIRILIEVGIIPMRTVNLLRNDLYPHPHGLQQLVSSKRQL